MEAFQRGQGKVRYMYGKYGLGRVDSTLCEG